jgi:polyisoprenoid-binding protein YceI
MKIHTAFCLIIALTSVGCDNDPVADAPRAETKEAVEQAAKPADAKAAEGAQVFSFSEQGSSFDFVGAKVTGKHDGKFKKFSGKVELVDGDPQKSKVTVTIEMKSVETDTPKLTGHLQSADFFDVEKFRESEFKSTKIEKAADGFTVTGNLTLHGITKSISFPAKIETNADQVNVTADFGINRKDFEIVYPGMPDDLIKDEVLIKLDLKAKKS